MKSSLELIEGILPMILFSMIGFVLDSTPYWVVFVLYLMVYTLNNSPTHKS